MVGPGLPHRALSAARQHAVQHRRGVRRARPTWSAAIVASYRADLEHTYRNSHPSMKALLGDDGPVAALGDFGPRSDPALEQGPRDACSATPRIRRCRRWRRAPAWRSRTRSASPTASGKPMATMPAHSGAMKMPAYLRTARVQFESRYTGTIITHVGGTSSAKWRAREIDSRGRGEDEMFDCPLAWR